MDLNSLAPVSDAQPVAILSPSGEPIETEGRPWIVWIHGKDSDRYRALLRKQTDARLKSVQRGRLNLNTATMESEAVELVASAIERWENPPTENGAPISCDPANVRRVLAALPYVREQLEQFVEDRANFLPH